MQRDIRKSDLYRQVQAFYEALYQPGTGQINDAAELCAAPDDRRAVFAGTLLEKFDGVPQTRICDIDLGSGTTRVLTRGPNTDRLPKYSPSGRQIAFLSDRHEAGDFQLYLLDPDSGAARATPPVEGWVEYLHWSPDGTRILLGVAGRGADVAGVQGAVTSKRGEGNLPAWMPKVERGEEDCRWRAAWIYNVVTGSLRQASEHGTNIWEAVWCGNERLAAITSPGPSEGRWYAARLRVIDTGTGVSREVYAPRAQLGALRASPSGRHIAVVDATCSDRWIVAGDLGLIETDSGQMLRIDTLGVDVSHVEWCSDSQLMLAGVREFQTTVMICDACSRTVAEIWSSHDLSTAETTVRVAALKKPGDCVFVAEGFTRAPEIGVLRHGRYESIKSFALGHVNATAIIKAVERVAWHAPDGLLIQGWLLLPMSEGPHPLVMNVHGGPVWNWRPAWFSRPGSMPVLLMLQRGYAVFLPNPRGSSGRGQEFARQVLGDMGGADSYDCLSGLDYLVRQGIADPSRLGVTGVSYGGYMSAWLVTQDTRFAAAVTVAPITNQVTHHLISNIPHFVKLFLADHYTNTCGKYFQRSPIVHAGKVKTPTLNICGALDRCTPPEEAVQFHNALLESAVKSALVVYPQEGHGIRSFPAAIDYGARLVGWFQEHMPSEANTERQQECAATTY